MSFLTELKRRNVIRVGVAYVVAAWVLLQVADLVLENIGAPDWIIQVMMLFIVLGFIAAVVIAWAYELTPEGIKRESEVERGESITAQTGRKLDRIIIGFLAVAVVILLADRFWTDDSPTGPAEATLAEQPGDAEVAPGESRAPASNSVAVLPFVAMSSGADDEYFADGLTEEILNALAQLPELLVTARTSAFSFKGQDKPVQEIAAALGVMHIVEGSIRRAGDRVRVTAQLVRADDGFHLWSQNYDSTEADTISVQENIAEQIAQAMDVVMDDEKRARMRQAGLRDVEAFVAYQKAEQLYDEAHGGADPLVMLAEANRYYEAVLERVPDFAPAYVRHSDLFIHMLNNDATDQPMPGVTPEQIAQALPNAQADYAAAVRHARTPQERHNAEFDQAFLSGNWRGIKSRIEAVIGDQGCSDPGWLPPILPLYEGGDRYLPRLREIRQCDPLVSSAWFNLARATLWEGDVDGAIAIAREGAEVAPGSWLTHTLIRALTAKGLYEEAENEIATRVEFEGDVPVFMGMVAAARGDRDMAQAHLDTHLQSEYASGFWAQIMHAWMGNLEQANELAAKFDRHLHGNFSLALVTVWCVCGAPFDLEATPKFAAAVRDAGFAWPPASPIKFPLKDW